MKKIVVLFLVTLSNVCFSQTNSLFERYDFNEIPWNKIELEISDSTLMELINKSTYLKYLRGSFGEGMTSFCHPVDIGNDLNIDIIFYWQTSLEDQLILYLNDGNKLNSSFSQYINLTKIESYLPSSGLKFYGITGLISGYPEASQLTEITIFPNGEYQIDGCVYYLDTQIPENFDMKIPFEVVNDKYRLRTKPLIENGKNDTDLGNLIGEFATGDTGLALAKSIDETGRVWWFVIMNNNIVKNNNYLHVDKDNSDVHRKKKVFGWISSRYVKTF